MSRSPIAQFRPDAFRFKGDSDTPQREPVAAQVAKCRSITGLREALLEIDTPEQQLLALQCLLQDPSLLHITRNLTLPEKDKTQLSESKMAQVCLDRLKAINC